MFGEEPSPCRLVSSPRNVTECDGKPLVGVYVSVTSSQDHSSRRAARQGGSGIIAERLLEGRRTLTVLTLVNVSLLSGLKDGTQYRVRDTDGARSERGRAQRGLACAE